MARSLEGRVIAITGSGGGLGRAYALAAAAAGASVVVADLDGDAAAAVATDIRARGGAAVPVAVDVAVTGAGEAIVEAARAAFGRLDGFVGNAAILGKGDIVHQSADVIARALAVNVAGVIDTATAAARSMSAGGRIVLIVSGSLLGHHPLALYGTTKAAVLGLVYGLAAELKDSGVRVTGLAPLAHTAMSDEMGGDVAGMGGPADGIAPVVTYLLSERSDRLNGHVLRFDGRHLGVFRPPRVERVVAAESWNDEQIADVVDTTLADEVASSGPGRVDPDIVLPR